VNDMCFVEPKVQKADNGEMSSLFPRSRHAGRNGSARGMRVTIEKFKEELPWVRLVF
jgi:hypothetical protein